MVVPDSLESAVTELPAPEKEELPIKKEPEQILRVEIREGLKALERPAASLFLSALSAGLDIGFSMFLIAVVLTQGKGTLSDIGLNLLVGFSYSVGFIFVVLGRSELFTEQTTLAVLPVLGGRASLSKLIRLWCVVYVANIIGTACFALIAVFVGPAVGSVNPRVFGDIAHRLVDHSSEGMLLGGIFAGWLMGLLSWLVAAGRDTISVIVIVLLITLFIGFANLPHVIVGSSEILGGLFSGGNIEPADFGRFLLWVTLGNIIGGSLFVALIKYGHARPETE